MSDQAEQWELTLYVGGQSPQSSTAIRNLRKMAEQHMSAQDHIIKIHDVLLQPDAVRRENILALPTLQRSVPLPTTRIIGDLSDIDRVWSALNDS